MDFYIDWSCQLLPITANHKEDASFCLQSLSALKEAHSFTHFCLVNTYDASNDPLAVFLLHQRLTREALCKILPKDLSVSFSTRALLNPELAQESELEKLLLPHSNCLPVLLPLGAYPDWVDATLNQLLYKRRLRLLLTSFELYPIFYPQDVINRLLRIEGAIYQFNFRALSDTRMRACITTLLERKATVLLGTSLDQPEKIYFYEQAYYLECAKRFLDPLLYQRLMYVNKSFWRI